MRKVLKNVGILVLALGLFFGMTLMSFAADGDIAGGVIDESYGQITWRIDKNGHLTVEGWGDLTDPQVRRGPLNIPWYDYVLKIYSANIDVTGMQDASLLFCGCEEIKMIDVTDFDTSNVKTMYGMFAYCEKVEEIDVSKFNTQNVVDMGGMFDGCFLLKQLDVSCFNTSKVTRTAHMFNGCRSLEQLDVRRFDTSKVTDITGMFAGCELLKTLDVSGFDLENAVYLGEMFYCCESLKTLNVSNFHLSNVNNVWGMFEGCKSLAYLDLSTFDLKDVVYGGDILAGCDSLNKIEAPLRLSKWNELPVRNEQEAWYKPDGTKITDLGQNASKSITLRRVAKNEFLDVYPTEWYVPYVNYVSEKKLMNGNGKFFTPNASMTRAMVVQTLYNMEGKPKITDYKACLELKDVYVDWYTDAVAWAYNEGITTGYDDTKTFEVNKSVTREELAAFLYRYANYKGYDTIQEGDFSGIENVNLVSPYAKNAMSWAVGAGLISGIEIKGNGIIIAKDLSPQGTATRAQMAAILQRFCIAYAEPVILEWNGHSYAVFDNCQTWEGSKAFCEAKGGHLAVIESAEENEALYNFIKENGYTSAYFGLSDTAKEGNWSWVNGEAAAYTNWNADEPGGGTDENYAMFFYLYEDGTWNDGAFKENVYDGGNAYICEWE